MSNDDSAIVAVVDIEYVIGFVVDVWWYDDVVVAVVGGVVGAAVAVAAAVGKLKKTTLEYQLINMKRVALELG